MHNTNEIIKTVDLHKSFGKLHVLQGVNETVKKGEVVKALANSGMKIVDIVKETGLSRSTVNRILRDNK